MNNESSAARRCIFCDSIIGSGEPGEHVYPKWLSKFLAKGEFFTHLPGEFREATHAPLEPWGDWKEHQSRDTGIQVRTVCRSCNHHWMSDLEAEASPILTQMIEGNAQGLDLHQQVLISRWATKTAMVWAELVAEEDRLYSPDEHRWAKDKPTPPPDTTVRLAHYNGTAAEWIEHKRVALFWELPPEPEPRGRPDAHRTIMVIGKLVIEVAVRRPADTLKIPVENIDIDDVLMPVWPSAQIRSWPPRIPVNDKTLESLHSPDEPD
jgi:hypothetical protein